MLKTKGRSDFLVSCTEEICGSVVENRYLYGTFKVPNELCSVGRGNKAGSTNVRKWSLDESSKYAGLFLVVLVGNATCYFLVFNVLCV